MYTLIWFDDPRGFFHFPVLTVGFLWECFLVRCEGLRTKGGVFAFIFCINCKAPWHKCKMCDIGLHEYTLIYLFSIAYLGANYSHNMDTLYQSSLYSRLCDCVCVKSPLVSFCICLQPAHIQSDPQTEQQLKAKGVNLSFGNVHKTPPVVCQQDITGMEQKRKWVHRFKQPIYKHTRLGKQRSHGLTRSLFIINPNPQHWN